MSDDQPLDDEQRAAVEADDRAIAVLAGPGSGKTRTLSHRARHLLRSDQDSKALLLTFTNKAAAEMKSRAVGVAAVRADRIDAGTFHNFGMRVLRSHGELLGLDREFDVLDELEARELAASVALANGTANHARAWSTSRMRQRKPSAAVAEFGESYQAAKLVAGVVDFDDLVALTAQLLAENPEMARAYGMSYAHLLVDEFQDTNAAQLQIVLALADHLSTISVFADDDQAIFRFVGAESANISRFVEKLEAVECPPHVQLPQQAEDRRRSQPPHLS
ncbi:AAA family ATPase [Conexibacter sp. W3-3-2]|uniref:UvrD-helicase domain-containing protein n=1 Tax=Conexibacter sp. W3-3-2 TaxID=2675227 RepID=UPI0012B86C0E|nr:UvrD-helicase domain-containing protein [Conexibacter sp. W3-3-2]MTD43642.1 AAA family ATPase [Conexibacter sp. W3-3-2]